MTKHITFTLTALVPLDFSEVFHMGYEGFIRDNGEIYIVKPLMDNPVRWTKAQAIAQASASTYGATYVPNLDRNLRLTVSSLEVHQSIVSNWLGELADYEAMMEWTRQQSIADAIIREQMEMEEDFANELSTLRFWFHRSLHHRGLQLEAVYWLEANTFRFDHPDIEGSQFMVDSWDRMYQCFYSPHYGMWIEEPF